MPSAASVEMTFPFSASDLVALRAFSLFVTDLVSLRAFRLRAGGWFSGLSGCFVNGLASLDGHLSDGESVAKMGHPSLRGWEFGRCFPYLSPGSQLVSARVSSHVPMSQRRNMGHPVPRGAGDVVGFQGVPWPVKVRELEPWLVLTVSGPEKVPTDGGMKVSLMMQKLPAISGVVQLLVWE
jgi:hypothetical protein